MKNISQIITKHEYNFFKVSGIYFYPTIPIDKIENAKKHYANIPSEDSLLFLLDGGGNGKKGYILTDKHLFSNLLKEKVSLAWKEVDTIYLAKGKVFVNEIPFISCTESIDYQWSQFLMIHEIFRSLTGKTLSFRSNKSITFPNNCVSCFTNKVEKKIDVTMYGLPEPNWTRKNWKKAGLFGFPFNILFGGTVSKKLFEYFIPLCSTCFSRLKRGEKRCILGWAWTTLPEKTIWFGANRYISAEIPYYKSISYLKDIGIEIWFRNIEFANEFQRLNDLT